MQIQLHANLPPPPPLVPPNPNTGSVNSLLIHQTLSCLQVSASDKKKVLEAVTLELPCCMQKPPPTPPLAAILYVVRIRSFVMTTSTSCLQVSASDKKKVLEAVKEAMEWVEENPEADADEFNDKRQEVGVRGGLWGPRGEGCQGDGKEEGHLPHGITLSCAAGDCAGN